MEVPQKIKNRTTKCFSNSTPGFLSKENKNSKTIYAPLFIAALFTIAKIWKHLKCPLIGEGIKNMWHMHAHTHTHTHTHTMEC